MFTIGHSTLPIETFLDILKNSGVRWLVDIRTIPRSRHNPQFAQESLQHSFKEAGLDYRWQKSLGGLRHATKDSINIGWRNGSFRGYADYMQTADFAMAIDELLSASLHQETCIMCAEAVPWRCHRSLVGDALLVRDIDVQDIFYDAKGHSRHEPHRMTPFAKVDGRRLWYPQENSLFPE